MKSNFERARLELRIANRGVAVQFYTLPAFGSRALVSGYGLPMTLDELDELLLTVHAEIVRRKELDGKQPGVSPIRERLADSARSGVGKR